MNQNKPYPETDSGNLSEQEWTELDRELAQMAEETPEMPADFHAQWTERIREEAAREEEKQGEETREKENREKASEKKKENRGQWRYILSAAAVFVFLITGTLLSRNNRDRATNSPIKTETETQRTETAAGSAAKSAANGIAADADDDVAVRAEYDTLGGADFAVPEAEESAEAEEAAEIRVYSYRAEKTAGAAEQDAGARWDTYRAENAAEAPAMMAAAYESPAENAGEETEEAAEEEAEREAETAESKAPAPEEKQEAAAAGKAEAETGKKTTEIGEETISFMKDMGRFALSALPWVLGGAGLAFLAALIDRTIRERRNRKQ